MDGEERHAAGSGSEPASFEELVDRHYRDLYQFALSLSGREAEAADLTQQTFTIWAEKGHQLREAGKARSWLYTTLHREFLKKRRHETRFPQVAVDEMETDLPGAAPDLVERMDAAAVLEAFQQVDETFRGALALFYMEENSYREIAEILDLPIGTVQSRIARGKAQLHRIVTSKAPGRASRG
jgi:RNA polymerase sigma-70 factor (ECF subfamily)